ncbi:Uncharacterized protein dnm_050940 [Desulfonema magnum]|uniref:Uncharacterized protein n=1 Tax=Desulfonema magnum TaxID=45655 RepID=A0A975BNZ6_9BACT|nr:Uncharacterized protein dnm_050940 [Desulfonema magnum]
MFKFSDPVRAKSPSFLRKQESIFGRCCASGAVDYCFRRNDRKKLDHRVSAILTGCRLGTCKKFRIKVLYLKYKNVISKVARWHVNLEYQNDENVFS